MATVKVEFTDSYEYRLVIDGKDDHDFVELGEPFQVDVAGKTYLTTQVDAEIECPVFLIIGRIETVAGVTFEDVQIEGDDDDTEIEVDESEEEPEK